MSELWAWGVGRKFCATATLAGNIPGYKVAAEYIIHQQQQQGLRELVIRQKEVKKKENSRTRKGAHELSLRVPLTIYPSAPPRNLF